MSTLKKKDGVKCVGFWSYGGGMGVSSLIASVARMLATHGEKVLIWEMCIDAPGTEYGIYNELHTQQGHNREGWLQLYEYYQQKGYLVEKCDHAFRHTCMYRLRPLQGNTLFTDSCCGFVDVFPAVFSIPHNDWLCSLGKFNDTTNTTHIHTFFNLLKNVFSQDGHTYILFDIQSGLRGISFLTDYKIADTLVVATDYASHKSSEGVELGIHSVYATNSIRSVIHAVRGKHTYETQGQILNFSPNETTVVYIPTVNDALSYGLQCLFRNEEYQKSISSIIEIF